MTETALKIQPTGYGVLVRRYTKPETVRGIIIPETVRHDETLSLWEYAGVMSPKARRHLGYELEEDDIVQTRPWRGTYVDDGLYIISAHEIIHTHRWK